MPSREVRPLPAHLAEALARLEENAMPKAWAVIAISTTGIQSVHGVHADPIGALRLADYVDRELNRDTDGARHRARVAKWRVSLLPFIPFEEPPTSPLV
jgi:hypothetical protein